MGDAYYSFGLFPRGEALEVYTAVLGAQVVHVGAGVGNDAAVCESGSNTALKLAGFLVHKGGGKADEALAAL